MTEQNALTISWEPVRPLSPEDRSIDSSPWPDASPAGPAPPPAPTPRLALAKPVQPRSGPIARPATPRLTTPTASDRLPHYPTASQNRARLAPVCLPDQSASMISPAAGAAGRQQPLGVATTTCVQLDCSGSRPRGRYPAPLSSLASSG